MPSSSQSPPPLPPAPRHRAYASPSRDAGVKCITCKVIRTLEGLGHPALDEADDEADDEHEVAQALSADAGRRAGKQRALSTPELRLTRHSPLAIAACILLGRLFRLPSMRTFDASDFSSSPDPPAAEISRQMRHHVLLTRRRAFCAAPSPRKRRVDRALDARATGQLHYAAGRKSRAPRRFCYGALNSSRRPAAGRVCTSASRCVSFLSILSSVMLSAIDLVGWDVGENLTRFPASRSSRCLQTGCLLRPIYHLAMQLITDDVVHGRDFGALAACEDHPGVKMICYYICVRDTALAFEHPFCKTLLNVRVFRCTKSEVKMAAESHFV
ncbi:hypothetical protein FB451DRAFT_1183331 [Mycena latifolia]|nr:hypothetical protein FB451DRAFT_1183331 [Mycena latifolia]